LFLEAKKLGCTPIIKGMGLFKLESFANGCCVVNMNTGGTDLFASSANHGSCVAESNDLNTAKMCEFISQKTG
jgi:hypothetical protein